MNKPDDCAAHKREIIDDVMRKAYYANIMTHRNGSTPTFMDMTKPREAYPLTEQNTLHLVTLRISQINDELRGLYRHMPSGKVYEYCGIIWQNSWGLEDQSKYIYIKLKDTSTDPNVILKIHGPNEISVDLVTFRESGSFVKI